MRLFFIDHRKEVITFKMLVLYNLLSQLFDMALRFSNKLEKFINRFHQKLFRCGIASAWNVAIDFIGMPALIAQLYLLLKTRSLRISTLDSLVPDSGLDLMVVIRYRLQRTKHQCLLHLADSTWLLGDAQISELSCFISWTLDSVHDIPLLLIWIFYISNFLS